MKNRNMKEVNYVLQPPDGGWGYMIVLSIILVSTCNAILVFNFGIIFGDFLRNSGNEISSTAILNSLFGVSSAATGLIINKVLTNYPLRTVGYIGATLYCVGGFLNIFAQDVTQLICTFGIIQGVGYGLISPVIYASLTNYFIKKRAVMNSIALTTVSIIVLVFPYLIQFLIDEYGHHGTLALIAAMSLHVLVGVTILQPVEWHMIKILKTEQECIPAEKIVLQDCGLPITPAPTPRNSQAVQPKCKINFIEIEQDLSNKLAKSLKKKTLCQMIVDALDLTLLKDFIFVNTIVGLAAIVVADVCFVYNIPLLLHRRGFLPTEIALTMTSGSIADVLGRLFQTVFNIFIKVKSRHCVLVGIICLGTLRFILAFSTNFTIIKIALIGVGFFRSWIFVPYPIVVTESCAPSRFPAALGLLMIFMCILYILLGAFVVIMATFYENDTITVSIFASISLVVAILWIVDLIYLQIKKQKS